jgi:hypothetical protein
MTREALLIESECEYAQVDTSGNSTEVVAGPCIYYGYSVTTALSAHTVIIKDTSTAVDAIAASAAVGSSHFIPNGVRITGTLVVDPDDSSTGNIAVFFRRLPGDGL